MLRPEGKGTGSEAMGASVKLLQSCRQEVVYENTGAGKWGQEKVARLGTYTKAETANLPVVRADLC